MELVVDASVAIKWVLKEPHQAEARRLLESGDDMCAPDLLLLEAAGALARHVRLKQLDAVEAAGAFVRLEMQPLRLEESTPLVPSALRLALELSHSAYDCVYLALALELDTTVVTADLRFVAACVRGGYGPHVQSLA
jgi:predicted nucleic acid-binding protein